LEQAKADVANAERVIVHEHAEQMKQQFKIAIEEGRRIESEIKRTGTELVQARAQAEPLWTQREVISKTRDALDKAFQANDFPSDEQAEEYEQRRAALTNEWHALTEKIIPLSGTIARLEAEHERLKFARSRAAMAVNDLRLGIRGELVGT
jgi:recombination DNA repair RAD52 pathway protein